MNFAQARYQSSQQGRFISVDPLGSSAATTAPQTFNRYSYVLNNPSNLTDPDGMMPYRSVDQSFGDVAHGFWGSGYIGGSGWGQSVRPGLRILNRRGADVRTTVRMDIVKRFMQRQFSPDEGEETVTHWWQSFWSVTRAWQSSNGITSGAGGVGNDVYKGSVYLCWRPTNFNYPFSPANKFVYHHWIKTDQKEAGLGELGGGVPGQDGGADLPYITETSVIDHTGESLKPNSECQLNPDADPDIANQQLEIGKPMGRFSSWNRSKAKDYLGISHSERVAKRFVMPVTPNRGVCDMRKHLR